MAISNIRLSFGTNVSKTTMSQKTFNNEREKNSIPVNDSIQPSLDNLQAYYAPSFGGLMSMLGLGTDAKVEKIIATIIDAINENKITDLKIDHQDNQCEIEFNLDGKNYKIEHDNMAEPSFGPVPAVVNQNRACITITDKDNKEEIHFIDGKQWNSIHDAAHIED